jgi:hypothetical protein
MFCRSFFVLLYFFFWPLCCLFFFDIQILITPLLSSNSSSSIKKARECTYAITSGQGLFRSRDFRVTSFPVTSLPVDPLHGSTANYFFFWPLCCLFFDIRILITPLLSSNSSSSIRVSSLILTIPPNIE